MVCCIPHSNTASCLTEARLEVGHGLLAKFHVTALRLGAGKGLLLEVCLKVGASRQQPLFSLRRLEFKYELLQKVGDRTFSIAEGLSPETCHALQRF